MIVRTQGGGRSTSVKEHCDRIKVDGMVNEDDGDWDVSLYWQFDEDDPVHFGEIEKGQNLTMTIPGDSPDQCGECMSFRSNVGGVEKTFKIFTKRRNEWQKENL